MEPAPYAAAARPILEHLERLPDPRSSWLAAYAPRRARAAHRAAVATLLAQLQALDPPPQDAAAIARFVLEPLRALPPGPEDATGRQRWGARRRPTGPSRPMLDADADRAAEFRRAMEFQVTYGLRPAGGWDPRATWASRAAEAGITAPAGAVAPALTAAQWRRLRWGISRPWWLLGVIGAAGLALIGWAAVAPAGLGLLVGGVVVGGAVAPVYRQFTRRRAALVAAIARRDPVPALAVTPSGNAMPLVALVTADLAEYPLGCVLRRTPPRALGDPGFCGWFFGDPWPDGWGVLVDPDGQMLVPATRLFASAWPPPPPEPPAGATGG